MNKQVPPRPSNRHLNSSTTGPSSTEEIHIDLLTKRLYLNERWKIYECLTLKCTGFWKVSDLTNYRAAWHTLRHLLFQHPQSSFCSTKIVQAKVTRDLHAVESNKLFQYLSFLSFAEQSSPSSFGNLSLGLYGTFRGSLVSSWLTFLRQLLSNHSLSLAVTKNSVLGTSS